MTPLNLEAHEERVLILTPTGADASVARNLLSKAGIPAESCRDLADLLLRMTEGAGALFIAQEALNHAAADQLVAALRAQEQWSDIPVVLLSTERLAVETETGILRTLTDVGNVMLVERPCRAGTLISVTRMALRARRRQYATRKLLDDRAKARDIAEQANLAKDRFLATLSHELRTPLTPVLATAGILANDKRLPKDVQDDLEVIHRNVELEARLIDDLLDLTRVSKGKLQLNLEIVDIHQVIRRVYHICCAEVNAKHQRIDFQLNAERPFVAADAARLHQMIWNLLKNAAKFTPDGGTINLTTRNVPTASTPNQQIIVEVKDSGIGIAPDQLPKLFAAFEQGGGNITRQFGGLGLGLAITKALADAHAGRVTANSEGLGKGATFSLHFPTVETPAAHPAKSLPEAAPAKTQHLRILLVEDHADTARVMARVLTAWGHEVTVAHSVAEARQSALRQQFDLVISDIGLPDGTGVEFIQSLRTHSRAPAIALSGFGMEEDVRRCLAAGFQAHVTKPVSFAKLEALINQFAAHPNGTTANSA
jgi:signal transduction histidine kinase/ActR/RegA family two-component response regulator